MDFQEPHDTAGKRVIRRPKVKDKTGLSDSALHREIHAGRFPRPFKLTPDGRTVGWLESSVDAWIDSRAQGAG